MGKGCYPTADAELGVKTEDILANRWEQCVAFRGEFCRRERQSEGRTENWQHDGRRRRSVCADNGTARGPMAKYMLMLKQRDNVDDCLLRKNS